MKYKTKYGALNQAPSPLERAGERLMRRAL